MLSQCFCMINQSYWSSLRFQLGMELVKQFMVNNHILASQDFPKFLDVLLEPGHQDFIYSYKLRQDMRQHQENLLNSHNMAILQVLPLVIIEQDRQDFVYSYNLHQDMRQQEGYLLNSHNMAILQVLLMVISYF